MSTCVLNTEVAAGVPGVRVGGARVCVWLLRRYATPLGVVVGPAWMVTAEADPRAACGCEMAPYGWSPRSEGTEPVLRAVLVCSARQLWMFGATRRQESGVGSGEGESPELA
ncbi:hypothetical protein GCM10010988_02190 [Cnuibacter physcomitrellae]|nr:hypothetical protein GCM10010988_02190 [Cnuibacter physcomitrellae]